MTTDPFQLLLTRRLAELREQHDAATNDANRARDHAGRLRGLSILDRSTPDEIEAAEQAASEAEARAADLGAALGILQGEHARADLTTLRRAAEQAADGYINATLAAFPVELNETGERSVRLAIARALAFPEPDDE